ncbi:GntR family transcriptional regulator [Amycolatopsis alkalitolerans]|uniref:Winged helix-turn-helix transcriptional regulator n=1 Tax=Amycolatopsis alkalitolerans TaxID=2547244 RepID=A0A5C4LQN7_9PSEU|nr:winged helix-turn-helix domain-containing protein [Amycolatopsis alkalitolerans]TNC20890.1 winged helix-turn-helix transcriptional regulator [Amycolatopsis alkalitolerans]
MSSERLDLDDPQRPFEQIAAKLRAAIDTGELQPGQQLKSVRALAVEYGVSGGTVQRALGALRDEGLVTSWQGRGAYVRRKPAEAGGKDARPSGPRGNTPDADLDQLRRTVESLASRVEAIEQQLGSEAP